MIIDLSKEANMSIEEALFIAKPHDTILLDGKVYYEKITLSTPNITIIGKEGSAISYCACSSHIIPTNLGGDGKKTFGTTGSATFRVLESANNFHVKNVTFINSHKRDLEHGNQAVAFKSEIHNLLVENCRFISKQDTLYIDNGINNRVINSYIEGEVDFIFGSADCIFYNCQIKGLKHHDPIYFTAPSTLIINDYGFVFKNCRFITENDKTYLGRPWYPGGAYQPPYPMLTLIDCDIIGDIDMSLLKMHHHDPDVYLLKYYNCKYNNDVVSNTSDIDNICNYVNKVVEEYEA